MAAGDRHSGDRKVFRYSWRPALTALGAGAALVALVSALSGFSPVGAGVIMALSLVAALYFASLALRVKLVIDDQGVTLYERQTTRVSWPNLHAVACAPVPGRRGVRQYRLLSHGQVVLTFESDLRDSERAYRTIERRLSVDLYPRCREALAHGEPVSFGAVSLSRDAVTLHHLNLPAAQVRLVREGPELLLVRRTSGDIIASVNEGDVPNVNLLMRLAAELDPALVNARAA